MQEQVTQLKLNVTNINKSVLFSNKQIKKLKNDKKSLLFKLEKRSELRAEEQRLETKKLNIGAGFSRIARAVTSPVKSIFDRILEFAGLVGAAILINSLPAIIAKIDESLNSDFIKNTGNILSVIGNGIMKLAEFTGILPKSDQDKIEEDIIETGKLFDKNIKDFDDTKGERDNLDKFLKEKEGDGQEEEQPTNISPAQVIPVPPESGIKLVPAGPTQSSPSMDSSSTQKLSSGGTVKGANSAKLSSQSIYQPKKSGVLKKAQRDANDGFRNFPLAVDNIHESTKEQEQNILAFSKMLKNSRELEILDSGKKTKSGNPDGSSRRSGGMLSQFTGPYNSGKTGSFASGAYIGKPGDPDGEQTGLNMNLSGGIGTPIYAPFDLIYRSKGTDGNPSVGLQGTPDALGPSGRGFGFYGAYRYMKNGKEYEVLMGHFKDLPFKGSKEGEIIKKGTLLGYQGASGRSISGTNSVYPHISLHVNGIGFRASNSELVDVADSIRTGKSSSSVTPKLTPYQKSLYTGNKDPGGGLRLNRSMNNKSVFIYAIQPQETFVPFPYPMPVEKIVPISSSSPQLSSIWRT